MKREQLQLLVAVRLSPSITQRFMGIAERQGRSHTDIIRLLVAEFIEREEAKWLTDTRTPMNT